MINNDLIMNRREDVILMLPDSAGALNEAFLSSTIESAGLAPRALLIVSTRSDESRAEMMTEVRSTVLLLLLLLLCCFQLDFLP